MSKAIRHIPALLPLAALGLAALVAGCRNDRDTAVPDGESEGRGYSTITLSLPRSLSDNGVTQSNHDRDDYLSRVNTLTLHAKADGEESVRRFRRRDTAPGSVTNGKPFEFWKVASSAPYDLYRTGVFAVQPHHSADFVLGANVPADFDLPFDPEATTRDLYSAGYDPANGVMKVGLPFEGTIHPGVTAEQAGGDYGGDEASQKKYNQFGATLEPVVAAVKVQFSWHLLDKSENKDSYGNNNGGYIHVNPYNEPKSVHKPDSSSYDERYALYVRIQGSLLTSSYLNPNGSKLFSYQPFFTVNNGARESYLYNTHAGDRTMDETSGRYRGFRSRIHDWGTAGFGALRDYTAVSDHLIRTGSDVQLSRLEAPLKPPTSVVEKTLGVRFLRPLPQPTYGESKENQHTSILPHSARMVSDSLYLSLDYERYALLFENSVDRDNFAGESQTDLYYRLPYVKLYCQMMSLSTHTRYVKYDNKTDVEFVPQSGTGQYYMLNAAGKPYPLSYGEMCDLLGLRMNVWDDLEAAEAKVKNTLYDRNYALRRLYAPLNKAEQAKVGSDPKYKKYREQGYGPDDSKPQSSPGVGSVQEGYVKAVHARNKKPVQLNSLNKVEKDLTPGSRNIMPRVFFVGAEDGRPYLDIVAAQTAVPGQKVYTFHSRCLYRLFVNPVYAADGKTLLSDEVRRNNLYTLTITDVLHIGLPYDPADPDDPYLPRVDYPWEAELPFVPAVADIKYEVTSWENISVDKPW